MFSIEKEKQNQKDESNFRLRMNVFFLGTFFVFSVLIIRLAYLQFVQGDLLKAKAIRSISKPVPILPIRGNIYDSAGEPIAFSISTQSLYYTFDSQMKEEEAQELAKKLVHIFNFYGDPETNKLTPKEVFEKMDLKGKVHLPFQPRRIKSELSNKEISFFKEHKQDFAQIDIVEESLRKYSEDRLAVQLIGYMKKFRGSKSLEKYKDINKKQKAREKHYIETEEVGFDGLEYLYQDVLRGENGTKQYPVNNVGKIIGPAKLHKPKKGQNLYLTINRKVQEATQQAIMSQINMAKQSSNAMYRNTQATSGYAVVMEVNTGKIIANASMPDYDPNIWQGGISAKDLEKIQFAYNNGTIREVQAPYANEKIRRNHPSSLVYLGSTQKPLSILLGLNEHLFTPSSQFEDPGYFKFGRQGHEVTIYNAYKRANGMLTAATAIERSSNAFMSAMVGDRLYKNLEGDKGLEIWDRYNEEFGLGVLTGSELRGESAGVKDYLRNVKVEGPQSVLIRAAWGQQAKYTTMQLAQYATMLANRGERMKPQFVEKIQDVNGKTTQKFQPKMLNKVHIPQNYWETIEQGMEKVPVQGFEGVPYSFRRKTGTSQQDVGKRMKVENGVFIAYAPAEKPKIAIAVVIPDGGFGGWSAAPIGRKIIDAYDANIGLYGQPRPELYQ